MAAVHFQFSRLGKSSIGTSWDLGHISIRVGVQEYTSKQREMACMIYVAISDLLSGIEALVSGPQETFEFVAADSSFRLTLKKVARSFEFLVEGNKSLGIVSESSVRDGIVNSVDAFMGANPLGDDEPVREDLLSALKKMRGIHVDI